LARFTGGGSVGAGSLPVAQIVQLLDHHEAAAPETNYTFTPGTPLSPDDFSAVIVKINLQSTASFKLEGLINGLATLYSSQRTRVNVGVVSGLSEVAQTTWELASTVLNQFTAANVQIEYMIYLNSENFPTNERLGGFVRAMCFDVSEQGGIYNNTVGENEISSLRIQAAASSWRIGSTMDTYGVTN